MSDDRLGDGMRWLRARQARERGLGELNGGARSVELDTFDDELGEPPPIDEDRLGSLGDIVDGRAPPARRKMVIEWFDAAADAALDEPARPLVEGLLDEGALSVIYGDSNAGKTFVALDLAFHVATGTTWNGRRVTRGLVVYIAAEGGRRIRASQHCGSATVTNTATTLRCHCSPSCATR